MLSPKTTTRTLSTLRVPSGDFPGIESSSNPIELGGAIQTRAGKTSETALKYLIQTLYIPLGYRNHSTPMRNLLAVDQA